MIKLSLSLLQDAQLTFLINSILTLKTLFFTLYKAFKILALGGRNAHIKTKLRTFFGTSICRKNIFL